MIVFQYKAKNRNAETIVGKIEAETKDAAIEKIIQFGLIPVTVEPEGSSASSDSKSLTAKNMASHGKTTNKLREGHVHVNLKELYLFSRQFGSLLRSGITVLHALHVLAKQAKSKYFKKVILKIHMDIQGGKSLSDSLSGYPRVFPLIYVNMSRAGEESGRLHEVISGVAEYLKSQMDIRNKVRTALVYPIMMFLFGMGAVAFILTSVMPKITQIFIDTDQQLPWPTQVVMQISDILIHGWAWILLVLLVVIFFFKQWFKTAIGMRFLYEVKLMIPVLGDMWLKEDLARFSRTMALLIDSGVSIVTAMKLSIPIVSNIFIQEELSKCQEELVAGRSFGEQVKFMKRIPDIMGDLISVGEEAGSLAPSLNDVAENYEQEINDYVKVMTTLFEPIMIVVIGAMIGFVVIAMLLPIFQMDIFS